MQLKLQVTIDENSGFCFGVTNAINKAEQQLEQGVRLYCLGEIVHNEEENERLRAKGMITISKEDLKTLKNQTVLFRAHGEPPQSYTIAASNGNTVVDASCPIILNIQKQIKKAHQQGEIIYIFGKHNHPEIEGLNGQINYSGNVFESFDELKIEKLPPKFTLFSQTTKDLEEFQSIYKLLKEKGFDIKIHDTICRQVSNRRENLIQFCQSYDVIIFVAGKNSSNGKILFDICKKANASAFFISSKNDIKTDWFKEGSNVGICGATSTPRWLMEEIKTHLLSL